MPSLEEILHKVVLADSEQINQGTEELREAFKKPDIVPSLCQIMGTAKDSQIRQYSAVLLRKRLSRKRNWNQLTTDIKKGIQDGIVQAVINEPERSVKNSIAQLIGVIVKHMKRIDQQWPDLMKFLTQSVQSSNLDEQELGTLTLAGIAEMNIDALATHLPLLCQMFKHVLESNSSQLSLLSVYNTITCMKLFIPALEKQKGCVNIYSNLIPLVVGAAIAMAPVDEDRSCEELELLEDLLEERDSIIQPHIQLIVSNSLQLALNQSLGPLVRNKAILLTGWIARKKKKTFLKLDLLRPTIDAMFQIMCTPSDEDEKEDDFESPQESSAPSKVAVQTVDALALCMPPEKIMPLLAQYVEPAVQGNDLFKKKAAYLVLAVVVDGCNSYVRSNCLEPFVLCIAKGIADPSPVVRNSALYALGQFSDHLQPDINKFAPQLLPVLFTYVEQVCASLASLGKEPAGVDRMFYALETFIENLEDDLQPFLPTLMERLLLTLDPSKTSPHLRTLALSAIGSVAKPAKDKLLPYFPAIIEVLKTYLTQPATTKELVDLQVQSLDTLGLLARGLGPDHFMPLAHESVKLGLSLVRHSDDEADLRKASYGLFAAVSTILKEEMWPDLPDIMECIHVSIQSNDGIVPHYKEEAEKAYPVFEDARELLEEDDINEENSDSEDDACSDLEAYTLKNSFIEEKEEALLALKELAETMGEKFNPYIRKSFDLVLNALSYPHEDVKTAALGAIAQLCINWHKMQTIDALSELREGLLALVPKVAELAHCDCDHTVVMACMEVYSSLLKELKGLVLQDAGHKEAIINCIANILKCETECQKQEEINNLAKIDEDEGGDEGEQDEMLFEYAADVLAPLGNAMNSDEFAVVFKNLFPIILGKTKSQCSLPQRSFATGMLAECLGPLGPTQLPGLLNQLFPLLLKLSADKEDDVCNNAVFALGELARHGKEAVFPYPFNPSVLSRSNNGAHLLDNVCGAIARLILANIDGVPLDQVLPVFLQQLPIRSDLEELKTVFECIAYLYQLGCPLLVQHLDRVTLAAADVIGTEKAPKETHDAIFELLRCIQRDFPEQFNAGIKQLSESDAARLDQCFIQKV
ncbi:hypothetical protein B566_EDAN006947 [Ephemera danica]|nr:hypothetical protein B566_EDAN006947 [Ephemera danica]